MEESRKGEGKATHKAGTGSAVTSSASATPPETTPPTVEENPQDVLLSVPIRNQRMMDHVDEETLKGKLFRADRDVAFQPLSIALRNVRANSRVLITIRDDQHAVWSEGDGRGLVGLSFSTNVDPALYLSNFLINAREFFVQTYADSQEILVQLYVRTTQRELRGRVDLPPNAVATLQSSTDRTSVVGLSAFAIDF
ncbi:hypothetical protein [Luteibacter sp. dw_328]|uniref:hypothetical protein n=1 Tax=Luteibacter sp. dw_328 TaxID=2719796 RepID=UPI001BD37B3C|nr:hypothetical protein [Luteibacter sp. dw_328]